MQFQTLPSPATAPPSGTWRIILGVCLGILAGQGEVLSAEGNGAPGSMAFDIPSQSLSEALETYGDITGWEVLYNSNFAVGRRSGAVKGRFTPPGALQVLLAGTGLMARYTDANSFVLVPATRPAINSGRAASPPPRWYYYGRIQDSLRTALCRNDAAQPGHYRIAAQFWIGPTGDVAHYQRLGSTGQSETDSRIDRTLSNLRIGAPPPAGFAEPVTILVVPQAPNVSLSCDSDPAGLQPVRAGP
jgi:hypothetical protein